MEAEQKLMAESLDIHNLSIDEVWSFLDELAAKESVLPDRSLLSIVGNILHGYFLFFSDKQKEALLKIMLSHPFGRDEGFDRNELLAIMFKVAPSRCRNDIFALIAEGSCDEDLPIQGLIANLNATRVIYDGLPDREKRWLRDAIVHLHKSRDFDPLVSPSIEYTLASMS